MTKDKQPSQQKEPMPSRSKAEESAENVPPTPEMIALVAQFRAGRESHGYKMLPEHDFAHVAAVAAQIYVKGMNPEEAAKEALKILDACKVEITERNRERERCIRGEGPLSIGSVMKREAKDIDHRWLQSRPHIDFTVGVREITEQARRERAEEYFRKFLCASENKGGMGMSQADTAARLKKLKAEGFSPVEVNDYVERYEKYTSPHKKTF